MTKLSEIGGEFGLIDRIARNWVGLDEEIDVERLGIGDDCAVLRPPGVDPGDPASPFLIVTCDMLVEGTHFLLDLSTPYDLGWKSMECSVSDIAAMGGVPLWAFVSLALHRDTEVEFADELYRGMTGSCEEHGYRIMGGDTTRGERMVVDVILIGKVEQDELSLRSGASPGELVCVTGDLGKSEAGLQFFMNAPEEEKRKELNKGPDDQHPCVQAHLRPRARLAWSRRLAPIARSMIDVSDGLVSDLLHICERSKVGARLVAEDIPVSDHTREMAAEYGMNLDPDTIRWSAIVWALRGGEDFELLFTIEKEDLEKLEALKAEGIPVSVIGEILPEEQGTYLVSKDHLDRTKETPFADLQKGWDHFADPKRVC